MNDITVRDIDNIWQFVYRFVRCASFSSSGKYLQSLYSSNYNIFTFLNFMGTIFYISIWGWNLLRTPKTYTNTSKTHNKSATPHFGAAKRPRTVVLGWFALAFTNVCICFGGSEGVPAPYRYIYIYIYIYMNKYYAFRGVFDFSGGGPLSGCLRCWTNQIRF